MPVAPPASLAPSEARPLTPTAMDRINCLWSAVSCWIMAGLFLTAWWWPLRLEDGRWVKLGVGILVLEFILLHAGGVLNHAMTKRSGRTGLAVIGLILFYTVFGVGIALAFQSWWIFSSFALVMSGRLWGVLTGESEMERAISQRRIGASALFFLGLVLATLFVPVPSGGVDPGLLQAVWPDRRGGVWERHPEKALAMGVAYFFLLGLVEARPPRSWRPPPGTN